MRAVFFSNICILIWSFFFLLVRFRSWIQRPILRSCAVSRVSPYRILIIFHDWLSSSSILLDSFRNTYSIAGILDWFLILTFRLWNYRWCFLLLMDFEIISIVRFLKLLISILFTLPFILFFFECVSISFGFLFVFFVFVGFWWWGEWCKLLLKMFIKLFQLRHFVFVVTFIVDILQVDFIHIFGWFLSIVEFRSDRR